MAVEIDGTSKGLLGAFAAFTLGSGIASLIYGVLLLLRYAGIQFNYGIFNLFYTSIILIVLGGLLIITVLLGVIGALKELSNVRFVTLILLFSLFIGFAIIGIWGMVSYKTGRLQNSIEADTKLYSETKYSDLNELDKQKADYLFKSYNCCGSFSTDDTRANDANLPESCCIVPGCGTTTLNNAPKYFKQGCAGVYFETKSKAVFHLAILSLVAAGLVLLALILYAVVSQRARAGYAAVSRG